MSCSVPTDDLTPAQARAIRAVPAKRPTRWWWAIAFAIVVGWMLWSLGFGRRDVVNGGGWTFVGSFFSAAVRPELSPDFLRSLWADTLTTIGFAMLGTLLAVAIGLIFGFLSSGTVWRSQQGGIVRLSGWRLGRLLLAIPRGIHEIVWGLFFVGVLGMNPLVAIFALGIPFGAITAKVYAELIDDASIRTFGTLTAAGASTTSAFLYGIVPIVSRDMVAYAFYRLECAIRSAAVVGFIGAGGLGFRLAQSNSGNAYREVWTVLYVLVILCLIGEQWSALVRTRDSRKVLVSSVAIGSALCIWSWFRLGIHPSTLWSERSRSSLALVGSSAWPPRLPGGGWMTLATETKATIQMSVLAMGLATTFGVMLALGAQRSGRQRSVGRRGLGVVLRFLILTVRAVPVTLWALLVVLIILPGILPGAIALAIYTAAVLARLFGEGLENSDQQVRSGLTALGGANIGTFAYGALPAVAPGWASAALYRWEVTTRETVVVGMVGAGGLGRVLQSQFTSFDYRGVLFTLLALIALTVAVDMVSATLRKRLR